MIQLLTLDDALRIHAQVIARTGGSDGVCDLGLRESALAQPSVPFGGEDFSPTIASKAAALAFSIIMNHAFVDGNKRVAHAAMETFLVLNDWEVSAPREEQEIVFLRLAAGEFSRDELLEWLNDRIKPIHL